MIQYSLHCAEGHDFDSWFQSAAAFDKLHKAGLVTCGVCGSNAVEKAIMAPRLGKVERDARPLSMAKTPAEQALAELRAHVEKNADYVGKDFAREARAIHEGEQQERAIWGEAKLEEVKQLAQDGVAIAPLPFTPGRKSN